MTIQTAGLHHVTAVASDPQRNVEFYTDVLGLRLIKQTVNFDDTHTYHLYYGDEVGTPGTVLTFFPFEGASPGDVGPGQASATAFVVPPGSIDYWRERLETHDVDVDEPRTRFGDTVLSFRDPDGQPLELVVGNADIDPWADGPVPAERAIRGFSGVTLDSLDPDGTRTVLEALGYERTDRDGDRARYRVPGERATVVDVVDRADDLRGRSGAGTVHHVAFRVPDAETQLEWREQLSALDVYVTPQKDRQYFEAIYFREPGGVLFEVATDGPGFTRDESVEELGSTLQLPPWLESDRDRLAAQLPDLDPTDATGVR